MMMMWWLVCGAHRSILGSRPLTPNNVVMIMVMVEFTRFYQFEFTLQSFPHVHIVTMSERAVAFACGELGWKNESAVMDMEEKSYFY